MQALILAGGKGTRLRPLTVYTPKPVVPVLNRPFLLYQIDILRLAGITDITLSLNYQPDRIADILGDGTRYGVKLTYVTEPRPLGTAGAYRFAADLISEPTVVLNGDILTDLGIEKMAEFHKAKQAEATIFLTPVGDPTAYGLVETGENNEVKRFLEKPKAEDLAQLNTNLINAGIYILEPRMFELIPENENRSFEYDVFPELLKQNKKFFAYTDRDVYWRDIGTPQSYLQAHLDLLAERLSSYPAEARDSSVYEKDDVSIDKTSVLGADCVIKSGVKIINSVIGNGVHIDEKSVVENSVVWAHARIGNSTTIDGAFVGQGCQIGNNVTVGEGSVLGDKTVLAHYTQV
ncbi:MAG TPA: NDP-sugar synthase [Pyrinomonadaceae bacterium]|jgi:NDP-sugar pyrophosphorylase family protein|nr:NDP-sugar synthase [Pyrinomonadaceae bacterium]